MGIPGFFEYGRGLVVEGVQAVVQQAVGPAPVVQRRAVNTPPDQRGGGQDQWGCPVVGGDMALGSVGSVKDGVNVRGVVRSMSRFLYRSRNRQIDIVQKGGWIQCLLPWNTSCDAVSMLEKYLINLQVVDRIGSGDPILECYRCDCIPFFCTGGRNREIS